MIFGFVHKFYVGDKYLYTYYYMCIYIYIYIYVIICICMNLGFVSHVFLYIGVNYVGITKSDVFFGSRHQSTNRYLLMEISFVGFVATARVEVHSWES